MTKYSIPNGHEWADEQQHEDGTGESPTTVVSHSVDVILTTDPSETMGYGREKYTVHIVDDQPGMDTPYAVYATKYRWKGNFWRDVLEVDWKDVPDCVKRKVASVVACDGVGDLSVSERVIEEGGRSTWRERGRLDGGDADDG